ncbi:MAG: ABC transporter ATP-binding protein [Planctomycetota bacterium]
MNQYCSPLQAVGVEKRFGRKVVLAGLDFEIPAGQVTVLLGRNGAGKTTLVRLCLGTERLTAGCLRVLGRDPVKDACGVRRRTGFVPDVPDAYDWMTAREWFRFLRPHFPGFSMEQALALCDSLAVPIKTPFRALSRGQAMKAMLVGAVAHAPDLLLLDEPFAGLDPLAHDDVLRAIIGEYRAGERTVLLTTHDLEVATRVADRIAILDGGRIVREMTPEDLEERSESRSLPAQLRHEMAESVEVC